MLELMLKYPRLTFRRYSVVFYNPNAKVFVPIESVFLGNVLATPWSQLIREFKQWFQYERLSHAQRGYEPLIRFDKTYSIISGEERNRKGKLFDFKPKEVLDELLRRVEAEYKARNLLLIGGDDAFRFQLSGVTAHVGDIILDGYVKSKTHGGLRDKKKFERVTVTGPFEDSKVIYADLYGESEDFVEATKKQGYSHVRLFDTNIAARLYYAKKYPHKVEGFRKLLKRRPKLTFFVPFYSERGKEPKLRAPHIHPDTTQIPLSYLKWSILMDYFFNKHSFYEIGKKLNEIEPLFHPIVISKLFDGVAGFEALVHSYPFSQEHMQQYPPPFRQFVMSMISALERQGYQLNGYQIEKKFSKYEVGSIEFTKDGEFVRLLLSPKYPPVYIKRRRSNNPVDIFRQVDTAIHQHPFAELFEPKTVFDDKTRTDQPYEVMVPFQFKIPQAMWADYKAVVATEFPGGTVALEQRLNERNIQNRSRIIKMMRA